MRLRARWAGAPPKPGDYLMSSTRPRFAYRVRDVACPDSIVRWDPEQKAEVRHLAIDVERVQVNAVSTTARVHAWRWDKRGSSKSKRLAH